MDRIREGRRTNMVANGLTRRRHRTNTLRDSPEEDGAMELQEPTRLRDRGSGKKDRDRERERERDRERERERERERDRLGRSKRRRGDRLMHSSREDGGDDTSEDSLNEEEEDEDDDGGAVGGAVGSGGGSVRMLPLNPSSLSSSSSTLNHHRKSLPPAKVFRPAPPTTWKAADEMIGVSVPRKARSASTKRSHECWASSSAITTEQNHRQASTSPVRTSVTTVAAPASPSSSNVSARKKIKSNGGGPKFRPPKSSSKSSSAHEEIEIEIAEVLYGLMRQPQGPSKQEALANDSREGNNKSSSDGKSRISSPISNSQSAPPQNSSSSATVIVPKRKKPRQVKHEDENPANFSVRSSPISLTTKAESDQASKFENCSSNLDKNNAGSALENLGNSQSEPVKVEGNVSSESKALTEESEKQKDVGVSPMETVVTNQSPKKESPVHQVDGERDEVKATKANPPMSEPENQREEKFQIDLMAPPPPLRSSPERDVEIHMVIEAEKEVKPSMKEDEKSSRLSKEEAVAMESAEKVRPMAEQAESQKQAIVQKERVIDLQLDLEKVDRGGDTSGCSSIANKKQHQNVQRQQQQQINSEKNVQANSVPIPMSVPSWPGGLPSMGYMAPLPGVVSMDGATVTSAAIPPPHLLFSQPRPKRCATHCYVARNIMYHQQMARMNPFWPAAAGSASLYGAKPGNLNAAPSAELHGNVPIRAQNSTQDKGHSLAMFPGHIGKDKGSQSASVDNSSRKPILLQQALPPGAAPSNILHGPAFIFPLNQQQAAAASVRPGSVKSLPVTSNGVSSSASNSAPPAASGTTAAAAAAPTMSFSYPNMPGNETQYLAILQNNGYPFPIPAHVGGPTPYRGTHAQAFPFFNGSFYSSQMLHPSQIQQQHLSVQSQQSQQQGHQNTSISSGSSSSQKHSQNQQQKSNTAGGSNGNGGGGGSGSASLQGFPVTKNPPSQPMQLQQQQQARQQLQNHHVSHLSRQMDSEMGGEDSPSTTDSRLAQAQAQAQATMNIYGQNFAMPMHTPNFALMTPASINGAGSNGSHSEKKQSQQHPGSKAGAGDMSQAFAMSFASINGATAATGLDLSTFAQNHSIMQSHHNYQLMAAAQAASVQNKKNYHVTEEGKTVVHSPSLDEDRKGISGKIPASVGQSIAFSRPDVSDPSISSLAGNNVMDGSGRNLNLGSTSSRGSAPAALNSNNNAVTSSQQQLQRNQQQQVLQLQKQNQFAAAAAAAAARNKTSSTSNGYPDNLPSTSSMNNKFQNAVSAFPQSLVQQSSSTVVQSPQWKSSVRPITSSQASQSMTSTPPSSGKTLTQQQSRQTQQQQAHTQISFAANPKSSPAQVQPASSTQSPSPVMVGSPTTSSMSKNTGSPRTTSTSTNNNKINQVSSLSSQQQSKNSSAVPARKSSPVGSRNVTSILSTPQLTPSPSTGSKSQVSQPQQQKQQQNSKQTLPQGQLFFTNPYIHSHVSQSNSSNSTTSGASGYYLQRRVPEQVQRQGSSGTSSNGAAANNNTKGSALPQQGLLHPSQFAAMTPSGNHHQFVPAGFPYVHPVTTAVQVKPAEQKQPAGE